MAHSVKYEPNNQQQNQHGHQTPPAREPYLYTIENRPPLNFNIPHPPLQTEYPKSIQNNIESRVINRPTLLRQTSVPSIPIPPSLPSIVHEPSNTVTTIQNVPSTFVSALNAQPYPLPVITSTYSNRETYSNNNAREKVVVQVFKAPGWYLNDENERQSYKDAVANGLLRDDGLVYVNNVQKENAQNTPINFTPSNGVPSPPPSPPFTQTSPAVYSSKSIIPPALVQNPSQPFSGYWPPCVAAYAHLLQSHSFKKRSSADVENLYNGRSSYDVSQQSVGRLAGDNSNQQYSLSSLRLPPQLQRQLQAQRRQ